MKLLILFLLLFSSVEVEARCLSRGEAVAAFPKAHLYWSVGKNGRCWANSLARARQDSKGDPPRLQQRRAIYYKDDPDPEPPVQQVLPPLPPPGEHPAPPLQAIPKTIEDFPQWAWVQAAREAQREEPFSSFNGEQPDVWPPLEPSAPKLILMLMLILLTVVVGMTAWRLHGRYFMPRKDYQWSSTRNSLLNYQSESMRPFEC
jgi:hypothetical protein